MYSATNPPYYEDKERQRGDNEVIDTKPTAAGTGVSGAWGKDCSATALQAMGDRLLDWFSVIMADAKRRRTHNKGKGQYICHVKNRWSAELTRSLLCALLICAMVIPTPQTTERITTLHINWT